MIKSMTGFGRSELKNELKAIVVEIRSVNNKYLKLNIRIPELLAEFEDKIEKLLKKELVRGTINLTIEYKSCDVMPKCVVNKDVLKEYYNIIGEARKEISFQQDVTLDNLISLPGVLEYKKDLGNGRTEDDGFWHELEQVVKLSINDLKKMREAEGQNLRTEINKWKNKISALLDEIETMAPKVVLDYSTRIQDRISTLLAGTDSKIEESDLHKEIAIFADRCDISEEIGRLKSHILLFDNVMDNEEPNGRKLEFIVQEMFREANTIASKANNSDIIKDVISIKTDIERIKEQILNIE
ncbi:stress-induced protein [Candidatus Scalindua japonica]|uniref:Stress-induced protein n=1 Tax=Candidatus Scalindua japonica TaxID=1284222 RepID=A0A286TUY0_9BACT|nr:YicC/YloC family endoribonuclease [Candidatus Scalindua japonica]GAX59645.1 stress-induced protein [Candidatus Scalindua japonica]